MNNQGSRRSHRFSPTLRLGWFCMLLICLFFIFSLAGSARQNWKVLVNGRPFDADAVVIDGTAYMPAAPLAQLLGARIVWDAVGDRVTINGQLLTRRCIREGGDILLPIKAVAAFFNAKITWDGARQLIEINNVPVPGGTQGNATPAPTTRPTPVAVVPTPTPVAWLPTPTPAPWRPTPTPRPGLTPRPILSPPPDTQAIFRPVHGSNGIFNIVVTELQPLSNIKQYYHPQPGNMFWKVHVQQQNLSNEVQIYTGTFSLGDTAGRVHEPIEGLSNFWLIILRPGGTNYGYLVFEIPTTVRPAELYLHALNQPPLRLNLLGQGRT